MNSRSKLWIRNILAFSILAGIGLSLGYALDPQKRVKSNGSIEAVDLGDRDDFRSFLQYRKNKIFREMEANWCEKFNCQ